MVSSFAEIALLAAKINNETSFCVFFDYSGHVDLLRISIRESKKNFNKELIASEFNVVLPTSPEEDSYYKVGGYNRYIPLSEMRKKKALLVYILESREIPYDSAIREEIKYIEETWSF